MPCSPNASMQLTRPSTRTEEMLLTQVGDLASPQDGGDGIEEAARIRGGGVGAIPEEREMKAVAVFPSQRELKLVDLSLPALASPTQARIRILDVGVCGTDR